MRWRRFHALQRGFGVLFQQRLSHHSCAVGQVVAFTGLRRSNQVFLHLFFVGQLVATSSAQLKPGKRCCREGSVRKILLLLFTFLLLQKSNKKGDPKSIYSPISGAALLNFSNSVVSSFVILLPHPEFSAVFYSSEQLW